MKIDLTFKGTGLLACMLTATLGINVANAQIDYRKEFPSKYEIKTFDNTTYCIAYLSNGELLALRDNPIITYNKINNIVFNPTGSSIAVSREGKEIRIFLSIKKTKSCLL